MNKYLKIALWAFGVLTVLAISILLVIRNSKDPAALLRTWHVSPEEKCDFSSGNQRVEVKSTSQRSRSHHFSLEQLNPPLGCKVVVASIFVERTGGGTSLSDLVKEINYSLENEPDLQERLARVVALTLGQALRKVSDSRFDRELSEESTRFFNGTDVPKILEPLPPDISDVHFKSDLRKCPPLTQEVLDGEGEIFALLKRSR